ncbi:hypothetical protein GTA09_31280 [Rhodococcus hoagii]|nr:hypothetical protein [Prescottella equi]
MASSARYHSRVDDVHYDTGFQRCASNSIVGVQGRHPQDDVADSKGLDPDPLVRAGILDTERSVDAAGKERCCGTPDDAPKTYGSEKT